MNYLKDLNPQQRAAVEHGAGPILILAGAGSGKTRVLTYRIAHLICEHGVDPSQIFAVTFTNKAAAEMKERVNQLLDSLGRTSSHHSDVWVSTFHSACVRILRSEIHHLGFSNPFTIYDDADQISVIKACLKELNISDNALSPKVVQSRINKLKNDGISFDLYKPDYTSYFEENFVEVFGRYSRALKSASALDFADLILTTVRLFETRPDILKQYQKRFPFVLIDEYQDTNRCQYLLMKNLAGATANICAVGDEDQSIYRWRGADISNIMNFEEDYPNAKIFKLEQNYRSTKNIIEAASRLIAENTERRDKELFTENASGELISVVESYDEHDEARKLVSEVMNQLSAGHSLAEVAVFYRTNAQSRVLEDRLRSQGLNYQIYGGLKFYSRLEVKDAMAYLRLILNSDDDVSFRRIVNVPTRGIGAKSVERVMKASAENGVSHYQLLDGIFTGKIDVDLGRGRKHLEKFYRLIEKLKPNLESLLPSDLLNYVLEESGYRQALISENSQESLSRLENLAELRQSIVEYELRSGGENPNEQISLVGFLEEVALVSDIDKFDPQAPALKMMTIHMAKGLEFDVVLVVGLEEELFPNVRSWDSETPEDVEEERRLLYVGMTRARKKLYLMYAKNRTIFGNTQFRVRSRFLDEIPEEYLDTKKADYFARRKSYIDRPGLPPFSHSVNNSDDENFNQLYNELDDFSQVPEDEFFAAGTQVTHPTFGRGIVRKNLGGDKLEVEFSGRKVKKISARVGLLKGV